LRRKLHAHRKDWELVPGEYAFTQTKNEFPEDLEIDKLLNR